MQPGPPPEPRKALPVRTILGHPFGNGNDVEHGIESSSEVRLTNHGKTVYLAGQEGI